MAEGCGGRSMVSPAMRKSPSGLVGLGAQAEQCPRPLLMAEGSTGPGGERQDES